MKKIVVAIGVVWGVILFSSCTQKGPEDVVEKYYTHLCKGEFDKMQVYVADAHHSTLGLLDKLQTAEERKEMAKTKVEVSNVQCEISDTKAICSCLVKVDEATPLPEFLKLKKVNKTWLVDFDILLNDDLPIMEMDEDENEEY